MPIVLKSGSLNLLEPSGPVQACNGIALPLQELNHPESEDENLPPSRVDVKNAWSYTSTPLCIFSMWYLIKQRDYFTFKYKHYDL